MPLARTPRLLRRGLELFAVISFLGVAVVLVFFGQDPEGFFAALTHLRGGWLLVGLALASMDWLGGGTRLWVVARHVHPGVRWRDMVIAGGMSAWAAYLTPFQTGAGPTMMWVMRRAGVRLPEAMTSTFMTFVATVVFFALAGPLAIYLGAGRSLAEHNVILGITYYGLFRTSLTIFGILGVLMLVAMIFPVWLRDAVHWLATRAEHRSSRVAARIEQLREGIDRAHDCLVAFGTPRGWLALLWAVLLSGPSHANKLLAGYVALRTLGLHTNFVDILLLQTFITFLLYFAPTPGSSGLAELLSAAVMNIYVRSPELPAYTLIWRFINSYATVIAGSLLFWHWLKRGLVGSEEPVVAEVLTTGVRLGAEPTPLLHGDKVEVGGNELTFVDERRSGSTQFSQKIHMPEGMEPVRSTGKPGVTTNTGGRVVSLTDGREYVIAGAVLVFGREAGCDVVVSGKDVSRRHAEVVQSPKGYLLVDSSTNGTFVNEERVQGQRILQRADVIRIGEESFRFYADMASAPADPPPPPPPPRPAPRPPSSATSPA